MVHQQEPEIRPDVLPGEIAAAIGHHTATAAAYGASTIMVRMLNGVPRYGGKGRPELNKWIRTLLPENVPVYCEPFGGVASILLNRPASRVEVVNDLSCDMYNWLRVVRDYPDRFTHLVTCTPWSRESYRWAVTFMERSPETGWLDAGAEYVTHRALAYHILLEQNRNHGERVTPSNWSLQHVDGTRRQMPRQRWSEAYPGHPRQNY